MNILPAFQSVQRPWGRKKLWTKKLDKGQNKAEKVSGEDVRQVEATRAKFLEATARVLSVSKELWDDSEWFLDERVI